MARTRVNGWWSRILALATAIALGLGLLALVWVLARALALIVLAVTLAAAFHPLVCRLERRVPRAAAVIGLYAAVFAGLGGLLFVVAPSPSDGLSQLGRQLPDLANRVSGAATRVLPIGSDAIRGLAEDGVSRLMGATTGLLSAGVDVLLVVFLSLYLLLEAHDAHHAGIRFVPPPQRRRASRLATQVFYEMGGYVRGAILNGLAVAGLTWLALLIAGVDYPLLLAVVAFFGELLPYLGPVVAAVPAVAVALSQSTPLAVTVALLYIGIQQVEGHVLTPVIMHSQTHISAALVIVALTIGYTVGGMLGAITAIPLFAAGRVLVAHLVAPALRRHARRGTRDGGRPGPTAQSPER